MALMSHFKPFILLLSGLFWRSVASAAPVNSDPVEAADEELPADRYNSQWTWQLRVAWGKRGERTDARIGLGFGPQWSLGDSCDIYEQDCRGYSFGESIYPLLGARGELLFGPLTGFALALGPTLAVGSLDQYPKGFMPFWRLGTHLSPTLSLRDGSLELRSGLEASKGASLALSPRDGREGGPFGLQLALDLDLLSPNPLTERELSISLYSILSPIYE